MTPDFNSKTVDIVAKRAAYCCSNPNCIANTIAPNADPKKTTTIGEAAHIYGARPKSARFNEQMTDVCRGEITNAIWLCRNCHKKIDSDVDRYSAELLFSWREEHEKSVLSKLGKESALIAANLNDSKLETYKDYPPIIRRIIIDEPSGFEYRITAELMRYLNAPHFRKLDDLRNKLYTRPIEHVDDQDIIQWVTERVNEMGAFMDPLTKLLESLSNSWGKPGEAGDVNEIHHICLLIKDLLQQVVRHEERLRFTNVSDEFEELINLLKDAIGSQIAKLKGIPDRLNEIVSMAEEMERKDNVDKPLVITETIEIELPPNWNKNMSRELRRAERLLLPEGESSQANSWFTYVLIASVLIWWMFF